MDIAFWILFTHRVGEFCVFSAYFWTINKQSYTTCEPVSKMQCPSLRILIIRQVCMMGSTLASLLIHTVQVCMLSNNSLPHAWVG